MYFHNIRFSTDLQQTSTHVNHSYTTATNTQRIACEHHTHPHGKPYSANLFIRLRKTVCSVTMGYDTLRCHRNVITS